MDPLSSKLRLHRDPVRRQRRKILIALALALFIGIAGIKIWRAWSHNQKPFSKIIPDLQYAPGSSDPFQSLDIYLPRKPKFKPIPLVVWIHGGAWVGGDKKSPPIADFLLNRGYAVASLNYRLSDKSKWPSQIYDCKAAIRYLRAHAKDYSLDPERIGVWGHSAGAHLAALLGTSGDVKELEGELGNNEFSSRVQGVAEWAGPTDFVSIGSQASPKCRIDFKSPNNPIAVLMGSSRSEADYLSASPVQYVSKDDPPILILHAQDDDLVPFGQAEEFDKILAKFSVPHRSHLSSYGGHGLFKQDFIIETLDYFDEQIGSLKRRIK